MAWLYLIHLVIQVPMVLAVLFGLSLHWPSSPGLKARPLSPHMNPCLCFKSWHFSSGNVAFSLNLVICGCKWEELLPPTRLSSPLLWGRTAQSCRGRQGREWRKLEKGEVQVGWETEEGAIQDPRRGWPAVPWTLTGIRTEDKNVALEVLYLKWRADLTFTCLEMAI